MDITTIMVTRGDRVITSRDLTAGLRLSRILSRIRSRSVWVCRLRLRRLRRRRVCAN